MIRRTRRRPRTRRERSMARSSRALSQPLRDAQAGEVRLEQAEHGEEDAKDGLEASDAPLEPGDPNAELGRRGVQARRGGDRLRRTPHPAGHRGARDADARGDGRVARLPDEPDEAVVVDPLPGLGRHSQMLRHSATRARRGRGDGRIIAVEKSNETCRRSWHVAGEIVKGSRSRPSSTRSSGVALAEVSRRGHHAAQLGGGRLLVVDAAVGEAAEAAVGVEEELLRAEVLQGPLDARRRSPPASPPRRCAG